MDYRNPRLAVLETNSVGKSKAMADDIDIDPHKR